MDVDVVGQEAAEGAVSVAVVVVEEDVDFK